ncbi:heterokaryon incompatibility protein-domain-containing protein [Cladorrhinum sp. PSN332]|nr:heterokaryon incompatibility protein-domain-containing protein [Cladorrhinum sp. PSN332]
MMSWAASWLVNLGQNLGRTLNIIGPLPTETPGPTTQVQALEDLNSNVSADSPKGNIIQYPSVPPSSSWCYTCDTFEGLHSFGIGKQRLWKSSGCTAGNGCQACRLRYIAAAHAEKEVRWPGRSGLVRLVFKGPIMRVTLLPPDELYKTHPPVKIMVSLYSRTGEPTSKWPIVGVSREISPRASVDTLSIIKEWIDDCQHNHPGCSSSTMGEAPLPTRVLAVGKASSERVYIQDAPSGKGQYTALSYCWGGDISSKTTKDNYDARRVGSEGIVVNQLPKTLQDAIAVTRYLGLEFLWIDALCIIQGDQADWEQESGNMAAVFQNAHVVLGADKARDSSEGFLELAETNTGIPVAFIEDELVTVYARATKCHEHSWTREPLSKRTWTLQEELLASRMIHFTGGEMIWRCESQTRCECTELDRKLTGKNKDSLHDEHPSARFTSADRDRWLAIVNSISDRKVTNPHDLLPALSGIATKFQQKGAGPYLAGMWKDDILRGLLWSTSDSQARLDPYRAPSWSWASVDNPTGNYRETGPYLKQMKQALSTVLEAQCTPAGSDTQGAVVDGYIKIRGPLTRMKFEWEGRKSVKNNVKPNISSLKRHPGIWHAESITCWCFGYLDDTHSPGMNHHQRNTLDCLFLGQSGIRGQPHHWGLILLPRILPGTTTCNGPDVFERIGWFTVEGELSFGVEDESTVTLV